LARGRLCVSAIECLASGFGFDLGAQDQKLGLSFMRKAVQTNSMAEVDPALRHFQEMFAIKPDLGEAEFARKNVVNMQQALLKSVR
jgi:hypothetical protein